MWKAALETEAGELDSRTAKTAAEAIDDLVTSISIWHHGDRIRIVDLGYLQREAGRQAVRDTRRRKRAIVI